MTGHWAWGLLGLALLFSCSRPSDPKPEPKLTLPAPASHYSASPVPVQNRSALAAQIGAEVVTTLTARGDEVAPDAALDATATWVLSGLEDEKKLDVFAADGASRRFGFGGIIVRVAAFDDADPAGWRTQLHRIPSNVRVSRYGVAVWPARHRACVVLGTVESSYEPIPRHLAPGTEARLRGNLDVRFEFARIFLAKPNGHVFEELLRDGQFDRAFKLDSPESIGSNWSEMVRRQAQ
jgi:hypothetical protein